MAAPAPVPFVPDVDTWVVTSGGSHRAYQIWVARPDGYTKQHAPYPVLYVGDANAVFGIAVETAYLLSLAKQIPPVVVVGIGYPKPGHGFNASSVGRLLDFTPPIDKAQADRMLKDWMDKSKAYGYETPTSVGGAQEFLTFIRQELIPSLQTRVAEIRSLAAQLRSHDYSGLSLDVHIFEGENHTSGHPQRSVLVCGPFIQMSVNQELTKLKRPIAVIDDRLARV